MKTVSRFVQKFASLIACVFSCFDRVIFKGHLSLSRAKEVEKFIDYLLKMRRVDFFKRCAPAFRCGQATACALPERCLRKVLLPKHPPAGNGPPVGAEQ